MNKPHGLHGGSVSSKVESSFGVCDSTRVYESGVQHGWVSLQTRDSKSRLHFEFKQIYEATRTSMDPAGRFPGDLEVVEPEQLGCVGQHSQSSFQQSVVHLGGKDSDFISHQAKVAQKKTVTHPFR